MEEEILKGWGSEKETLEGWGSKEEILEGGGSVEETNWWSENVMVGGDVEGRGGGAGEGES